MGKFKTYKRGLSAFISSEKGQRFFNFAYSIGAAIVIWGALFKILHLPGGNGPHTGDGFQKLTLSVALHSGNAQDLVSVHLKGDTPYGR